MSRKLFLTIVAVVASSIGLATLLIPAIFLDQVKHAAPSETANVMARTVGILLLTVGVLNFLVRSHDDSPTLRAVLIANLFLQLGISPIDPAAYFSGVYPSMDAFVPNTILHFLLAGGFVFYILQMSRARDGERQFGPTASRV